MTASIGGQFGRYRVEALLGEGGMGKVFRAFDTVLQRPVALKILQNVEIEGNDLSTRRAGIERLLTEARAAAAMDHPHVVTVYDVGEQAGVPFVAMQLLEGQSLRAFVGQTSPDVDTRILWLLQIAQALSAAHRLGIIHRDIKPENVLVCAGGVKVLDFGIAKRVAAGTSAPVSVPGRIVGTPAYMAPEQRVGRPTDARSDQYAWGVVAYELLTGRLPEQPPLPVRTWAPALPTDAAAAIDRALAQAPEARFSSMDALLGAVPRVTLNQAQHSAPPMAVAAPPRAPTTGDAQVSPWAPTVHGPPTGPPSRLAPPPPVGSAPPFMPIAAGSAPGLPTLHSPGAPPPVRSRAGIVIAAIVVGLVVAAGAGAAGTYVYTHRSTALGGDAGTAIVDGAPAAVVAVPDAATVAAHDAAAPAVAHDAGHAAHDAGPPPAPQHIRTLVGNSPTYSFDEMNRVVNPQRKALERCLVGQHLPLNASAFGFNLTIKDDGSIMQVSGRTDSAVGKCMASQLSTMVFPPLKNGQLLAIASVSITVGE